MLGILKDGGNATGTSAAAAAAAAAPRLRGSALVAIHLGSKVVTLTLRADPIALFEALPTETASASSTYDQRRKPLQRQPHATCSQVRRSHHRRQEEESEILSE